MRDKRAAFQFWTIKEETNFFAKQFGIQVKTWKCSSQFPLSSLPQLYHTSTVQSKCKKIPWKSVQVEEDWKEENEIQLQVCG